MHSGKVIVFGFALALVAGCSNSNKPTTQPVAKAAIEQSEAASNETSATATAGATNVAADNLAGDWQLAVPRQQVQQASIAATDGERVKIDAGDVLSGDYVKQGDFLLILTRDPRLQTLAWKINSEDSLTVVRSPSLGEGSVNYTGFTLVRAPSDSMASDSSEVDSTASSSSESDSSGSDSSARSSDEAQTDGDEALEQ